MSRGRGSRIPGMAAGLLARARRALARLDPVKWVTAHRHADIYAPTSLFAIGATAFAFSAVPVLNIVIGLPPLAFILLVMIRAHRANMARRKAVMGEIAGTRYLACRCAEHLRLLATHLPDDRRARLILSRLSSGIVLLVTRYREYLDEGAVKAAITAERLTLDAELAEGNEIAHRVSAIGHQLDIVGNGILDVDDRRVSDGLGRI